MNRRAGWDTHGLPVEIGVEKKLGNKRFVEGAPAAVVELERKKKADAETKIAVLKETLKSLGA